MRSSRGLMRRHVAVQRCTRSTPWPQSESKRVSSGSRASTRPVGLAGPNFEKRHPADVDPVSGTPAEVYRPAEGFTFARFNPDLGDTQVYLVNPDGTGQRLIQAPTETGECPMWFSEAPILRPAGRRSAAAQRSSTPTTERSASSTRGTRGSSIHAAARRLTEGCSSARRSAMTAVRTASTRSEPPMAVASRRSPRVPAATTIPGDWSPNGKRIVFLRTTVDALFVVNINGTGLKQITPAGLDFSSFGSWSPQGNEIGLLATRDAGRAQLDLGRAYRRHRPA